MNLWDGATSTELTPAVGLIELAKLEGSKVSFKIPPRHRWGDDDASPFDEDGWFFASFVFQLLNAFQTWKLVDLGTQLPIR